jgi:hypothetical protein
LSLSLKLSLLLSLFVSACGVTSCAKAADSTNLTLGGKVEVSSRASAEQDGNKITDGLITNESRWLSANRPGPHTITIQLAKTEKIGAVQVLSGWEDKGKWKSQLRDFVVQYRVGAEWKNIPEGEITANDKAFLNIKLANPVNTNALRLVIQDAGTVRVFEVRAYAPGASTPEVKWPMIVDPTVAALSVTPIFVNQSGYDLDGPKRFTVPTLPDGTVFTVQNAKTQNVGFRGTIRNKMGDFSAFRPTDENADWKIHAGNLQSDAFRVAPLFIERIALEPALRFMVDNRSVVGTHNSAYGGMAWRDGAYYSYELPSLVMLYQAAPDYFEHAPIEISYAKDKVRVLNPAFKLDRQASDEGVLEAVRAYYTTLDAPVGEHVPDIIQLIHWGIGWHLMKPESRDPSNDPAGRKVHAQSVAQVAYFLDAFPHLKSYFSKAFYQKARDFAFEQWTKVGLLQVNTEIGTFKGRNAPGHTILPNLLMYQVAKRENRPDANQFLQAAQAQAKWLVENLDPATPEVTKGQRMSEHMTMTGLTTLLRDYPAAAPAGLKNWLQKWADIVIARSDNEWDFRRYDETNWSLPRTAPGASGGSGWNEPGNLAGFPACALSVAPLLDDQSKAARLREIATTQWDALFGRNPIGAHAANRFQDWLGAERGWPKKFPDNTTARLETVRGSISSSAGSEHYPFNPKGEFRHAEGWSAFNAALNVGLVYMLRDKTKISFWDDRFGKPLSTSTTRPKQIGIELRGPLSSLVSITPVAQVELLVSGKTPQKIVLKRSDAEGLRFRGTVDIPTKGEVSVTYGLGMMRQVARWE